MTRLAVSRDLSGPSQKRGAAPHPAGILSASIPRSSVLRCGGGVIALRLRYQGAEEILRTKDDEKSFVWGRRHDGAWPMIEPEPHRREDGPPGAVPSSFLFRTDASVPSTGAFVFPKPSIAAAGARWVDLRLQFG